MVGKKGGKDWGQKKITGFFAKPPSSKQHDLEAKHQKIEDDSITRRRINSDDDEVDGRCVLEDVTNALEDSLQSPAKVEPPEDSEVIERTPEINPNKRKSKIKMRKTVLSKVVGESSKRKLVSDEGAIVTSPVFKKDKLTSATLCNGDWFSKTANPSKNCLTTASLEKRRQAAVLSTAHPLPSNIASISLKRPLPP